MSGLWVQLQKKTNQNNNKKSDDEYWLHAAVLLTSPPPVFLCFPIPQWSMTGSSLRSGVTTRSLSSTCRRSQRARPSRQPSFAFTRSAWAKRFATTPSCSKSTRSSRSTLTGTSTHERPFTLGSFKKKWSYLPMSRLLKLPEFHG